MNLNEGDDRTLYTYDKIKAIVRAAMEKGTKRENNRRKGKKENN